MKDITSETFGRLRVIKRDGNFKRWFCKCSCGKEVLVKESKLTSGHTKSCGCARTETPVKYMIDKAVKANRKLSTGMRFGRLVLVEVYPTVAICDCGSTVSIGRTAILLNGDLKSCGCLNSDNARKKVEKIAMDYRKAKGCNPDTPMSGKNKLQREYFSKNVSPMILRRDDYICAICGSRGVKLNVHHIIPWSESESLRFDSSNLITLCVDCHIPIAHCGNVHGEVCKKTQSLLQNKVSDLC